MKKLLLLSIFLTACGRNVTPTVTPLPSATAAPTALSIATVTQSASTQPSASALPLSTPAAPVNLTIPTSDNLRLAASYYAPVPVERGAGEKASGVLLLHTLDRVGGCACRKDWDGFALELQKRGIAALALDLRGHGESPGPENWSKAPADVRAAWEALIARAEVDPQGSAIVGASIGANLALIVGANNPDVTAVIALSPGNDYHGLRPSGLLNNFGVRPVLLVASRDDSYSYDSVQQMASQSSALETHYLAKAGHGTAMLSDPALAPLLLGWLQQKLGILKG